MASIHIILHRIGFNSDSSDNCQLSSLSVTSILSRDITTNPDWDIFERLYGSRCGNDNTGGAGSNGGGVVQQGKNGPLVHTLDSTPFVITVSSFLEVSWTLFFLNPILFILFGYFWKWKTYNCCETKAEFQYICWHVTFSVWFDLAASSIIIVRKRRGMMCTTNNDLDCFLSQKE